MKKLKNKKSYFYDKFPSSKIYSIDGKIAVDFIGKFENLKSDVLKIKKILKLTNEKYPLDHVKKNTSKSDLKFYNKESKKLIRDIWKKDFEYFGYKFPDTKNI